jgi:tyrosine decarboxylase/aspartate 1-decarboxylase
MQEKGIPRKKILNTLDDRLAVDLTYSSGKILGSMCTNPHDFALEVNSKYSYKNLGDPGLFPGSMEIESELVRDLGKFFGGNNITGNIVSGGTEANIIALRLAKKLKPNILEPEIVCSANAHMSFYKGADLLGIKVQKVRLTENYVPDINEFASKINNNTIALIGIAGTTSLGLVEPITEIAKLSEPEQIFMHVDAAFGGFVLPFMEELGYNYPKYDFRIPTVDSLTADPHKMGLGIIPSGGFLIREQFITDEFGFSMPYLAGGDFRHLTITGTRPGGSVIAFWALMKHLGRKGFRNMVKECWENTLYLEKRIDEIDGIKNVCKPEINIIGLRASENITKSIHIIDENLRKLGWALGVFENLNLARIVLMPHIKRHHLEEFSLDLEKVVKKIRLER